MTETTQADKSAEASTSVNDQHHGVDEDVNTGTATSSGTSSSEGARSAPDRPGWSRMRWQLRRAWAQLTSMRTALVLLFLLALAAVPGAALPQRRLNQNKVDAYFTDHPKLAPFLDKLSAFDVFTSPWFSAIYLLLFVSLIGCLVGRLKVHVRGVFAGPPAAPRNLHRLPAYADLGDLDASPAQAVARIRAVLRPRGWRRLKARTDADGTVTLSGERGRLREVGNLVFHFSLVAVLLGVATGSFWGWNGGAAVVEGTAFCDTVQAYDQFSPGRLIKDSSLPPFCVSIKDFHARYLHNGQPVSYRSNISYTTGTGANTPSKQFELSVNHPLRLHGASVYLINHGYAPILRYTDRYGTVFESPTPFLPRDGMWTSEGVVALPDANQDPHGNKRTPNVQVAFQGVYLPTLASNGMGAHSVSPERKNEGMSVAAYRGDTGMDSGVPHSVYSLDNTKIDNGDLKQIGARFLRPGESWTLDDGTTVTFVGSKQWVSLEVAADPGRPVVLAGAVGMVGGLLASLFVRRRRVFVRVSPRNGASTDSSAPRIGVEIAGLARTDSDAYDAEFRRMTETMRAQLSSTPDSSPTGGADPDASSGPKSAGISKE